MRSFRNGLIQIAGVKDRREADLLIEAGVDWLGFPLRLPVHQEDFTEDEAAEIIRALPPHHPGVLITYFEDAQEIFAFCRKLGTRHVQIHGNISSAELARLRDLAPALFVIKSLIVRNDNSSELARTIRACEQFVHAFITDTYDPTTGACGATGKTHDWFVSRELVQLSSRPVILAGGLTPDNVRQAIARVRPAGVDAHTGVEGSDGRKDLRLVRRFVAEARAAFRALEV